MRKQAYFLLVTLLLFLLAVPPIYAQAPFKIGFLVPLTGVYSDQGNTIKDGFFLKMKEAGFRTGQHRIEIIVEDTEAKPAVGVTKTRKLVEKDKVDIIVGPMSSAVGLAVRDFCHEAKVPQVIAASVATMALSFEKKSPYVWRCSTCAGQTLIGVSDYMINTLGYKKAVIMVPDYSWGHDVLKVFTKDFKNNGGKVIQSIITPFPTLDFAPYLSKIDPAADCVYAEYSGADAVRLIKQYKSYGMWKKMPLTGGAIIMQEMLDAEGDDAIGIIGGMFYSSEIDTPVNKDYVKAFRAEYKYIPAGVSTAAYEGATAILMALKAIENNVHDREAFLKALAKVSFVGPRGPFSFEQETHNVITNNYILKVIKKDGQMLLDVVKTIPNTKASQVKALISD